MVRRRWYGKKKDVPDIFIKFVETYPYGIPMEACSYESIFL